MTEDNSAETILAKCRLLTRPQQRRVAAIADTFLAEFQGLASPSENHDLDAQEDQGHEDLPMTRPYLTDSDADHIVSSCLLITSSMYRPRDRHLCNPAQSRE